MHCRHGLQLRGRNGLTPDLSGTSMQISVIIPTLNEAASIGPLVRFIMQHSSGHVAQVIVVDAHSTDGTAEAATQAGAIVIACAARCRATQMNLGARKATGSMLYFVHADVQLLPTFAHDILQGLHSGACAGCYRYRFNSGKWLLRVNAWCTRFGGLICRGGDQTLFIQRGLFEKLGGFNEFYTIMEDYDMVRRIKKEGRFVILPKSIRVSARKYQHNSWLKVQVANLTVFSMYVLGISPNRMRRIYGRILRPD